MSADTPILMCRPAPLPDHLLIAAADLAGRVNPQNRPTVPPGMPRPTPARLAAMTGKFWTSGQELTWTWIDGGNKDKALCELMQGVYDRWMEWINLTIRWTANQADADFRWTRESGGYWHMIGLDCSSVPTGQATGNVEAFTARTPLSMWKSIADHEAGHGFGFGHTQLLPEIVNRIDPEKAYRYFGGPPNNWPKSVTKANVLQPYRPGEVTLANVQLTSVMMYGLPASIMKDGIAIPGGKGITPQDGAAAAEVYPGRVPVKPAPPPGGPPMILLGVPVQGKIDFATEVDQYRVEITEPGRYVAETDPPMHIGIFKGEGTGKPIDQGFDEAAPMARLKPGLHTFKVIHRMSKGTGPYTLTVAKV